MRQAGRGAIPGPSLWIDIPAPGEKGEAWNERKGCRNKQFTPAKTLRNNPSRYCIHNIQAISEGGIEMLALAAAGAFLGLFTLWVVLPRKFFRNNK